MEGTAHPLPATSFFWRGLYPEEVIASFWIFLGPEKILEDPFRSRRCRHVPVFQLPPLPFFIEVAEIQMDGQGKRCRDRGKPVFKKRGPQSGSGEEGLRPPHLHWYESLSTKKENDEEFGDHFGMDRDEGELKVP